MLQAATLGDRQAMVYMAKAYETGTGLGSQRYSIPTHVMLTISPTRPCIVQTKCAFPALLSVGDGKKSRGVYQGCIFFLQIHLIEEPQQPVKPSRVPQGKPTFSVLRYVAQSWAACPLYTLTSSKLQLATSKSHSLIHKPNQNKTGEEQYRNSNEKCCGRGKNDKKLCIRSCAGCFVKDIPALCCL